MGFFDKIKNMVGATGVKLEFKYVENPWPYFDPMIKATINVTSGKDPVTVIGVKGTFYAKRVVNGVEEKIELGTEVRDAENCAKTERNGEWVKEFPWVVEGGGEVSYGYWVKDMDVPATLADWGGDTPENAQKNGITFFLECEVDIKETLDLFDPSLTQEITVYNNGRQEDEEEYEEEIDAPISIYSEVVELPGEDEEIKFTPEQSELILSGNHEEVEFELDGIEVYAVYSLGQMNGKVVRMTDDLFGTTRVGLFRINHINGHRNLDFSNPDNWRKISIDSLSFTFSRPNEWGSEATRYESLSHIKNIALLKQ
ncbi:hypothetical protein VF12_39905 [Nostoc linckia z15]|nr:hypothetical protein VF12_39905 [Nostoc linckia z15]